MNAAIASATSASAGHGTAARRARTLRRVEGGAAASAGGIGEEVLGAVNLAEAGAGNLDARIVARAGDEWPVGGVRQHRRAGHEDLDAPRVLAELRQVGAGAHLVCVSVKDPADV